MPPYRATIEHSVFTLTSFAPEVGAFCLRLLQYLLAASNDLTICLLLPGCLHACMHMPVCLPCHCRAEAAGIDRCFIVGGIHSKDVNLLGSPSQPNGSATWDESALLEECKTHGVDVPTFAMAYMQW